MDIEEQIQEALSGVRICPCCGQPMKGVAE